MKRTWGVFILTGAIFAGFLAGRATNPSCKACRGFRQRICELEEKVNEFNQKRYSSREKYINILVDDCKLAEMETAVDEGDVSSIRKLALQYVCKAGRTEKDLARAFQLYEKLAAASDSKGMMNIANFYAEGLIDGRRDASKAYEWYAKAADMGDFIGAAHIAGLYISGALNPDFNNEDEALWTKRAEEIVNSANNVNEFYGIGQLFLRGQLLRKDPEKALYYIKKAANEDHRGAMSALARMYYEEEDFQKAREWLDKGFCLDGSGTLESFVLKCTPDEATRRRNWYLSGCK
jgi:tetratricopeptide (TPR) repeat protein